MGFYMADDFFDIYQKMLTAGDPSRCGARTRRGTPCQRKTLQNGRCPNHGGMSTGPRTVEGKARIAEAQRKRWRRWRGERAKVKGSEMEGISPGN